MRRCDAFLLLSLLLVKNTQGAKHACDWRTTISNGTVLRNGNLLSLEDGNVYPEGTFWFEENGEVFFACPCVLNNCIQICENATLENEMRSYDTRRGKLLVCENNTQRVVAIEDYFNVLRFSKCLNPHLLTEDEHDRFQLFLNGSLFFPPSSVTKLPMMMHPTEFCIIPMNEPELSRVVTCIARVAHSNQELLNITVKYFLLYTRCISCFFLLMIVIAFFLSADLKNLHGRAVACFSASLLLTYLHSILKTLLHTNFYGCIASAYFFYFFKEASMFWLNVICLDIYQTFKGFFSRRRNINSIYPSLYAWGGPALLTIIVLILDLTTENDTFSPGISSSQNCWFQGFWSSLLYVYAPVRMLLTVNLVLFCVTARQLWCHRRESRTSFRGTSRRVNVKDNDQFKLYLKLFLLMAITSVNMVILNISLLCDVYDTWYISLIVRSINNLRGPLFFWLSVWSRKNVRNQVLAALTCRQKNQPMHTLSTESTLKGNSIVSTINVTSGASRNAEDAAT